MINEFFDQLENILPSLEELDEFKEFSEGFNNSFFKEIPIDLVAKGAKDFESLDLKYDFSDLKKKADTLDNYRNKKCELEHKISECDSDYKKMLEHKTRLQDKMKEFGTDRDIILAYKLGTLSHLCFTPKIKFGFLLDKNNLDHHTTFSCDLDSNLPEEVECRWKILKLFVNPESNNSPSE